MPQKSENSMTTVLYYVTEYTIMMEKEMPNDDFVELLENFNKWCIDALSSIVLNKTVILYGTPSHSKMMIATFKNAGAKDVIGVESGIRSQSNVSNYNYHLNKELKFPSELLLKRINEIDPEKRSIIYAGSTTDIQWIEDRKIIGSRLQSWSVLETKQEQTKVLSSQAGYNSVFMNIDVLSRKDFIDLCMKRIPCVLSGELKEGIEMGSNHVFIINENTQNSLDKIYQILRNDCTGFRIANFIDGLPITVYGFCNGNNSVYYYPPVVGIVGYSYTDGRIIAPGIIAAKILDADLDDIYKSVTEISCKVVKEYGYCGAFGVDGVFNGGKYTIHDFNPRICAGFSLLSKISGGKVPHNIVDILMREHTPMPLEMLTLLKKIMCSIKYCNEIVIWNDVVLSDYLTTKSRNQSSNWNDQMMRLVLNENTPLFKTS